jgi:heme/copper-type cytochrome/quinol oxidase subunit 3
LLSGYEKLIPSAIAAYAATPARRRTLVIVALHLLIYSALLVWMFRVRATADDWPIPFEFGSLLMIFAMAMGGFCGSVTQAVAANRADRGETEEPVRWIAIAISAWLVFLFLECVEWVRMIYLVQLGPDTPFGMTYLVVTGAHWVAVIACVAWFSFCLTDVRKRDILASALYSHFLAIWWIVIVFVIYFPNMDPLKNL